MLFGVLLVSDYILKGQKLSRFSRFWPFSRKFVPRHILNSKLAKVFAREIIENSRLAKVFFPSNFFSYFHFFALLFLNHPDL